MENTKEIADSIVEALVNKLSKENLQSIKSIYIPGSYSRGDWLNCSSDLDIHIISSGYIESKQNDLIKIRGIIEKAIDSKIFYSHTPGGVDYGFNGIDNIPKTIEEALKPSPYAYFSTFMFDIKKYCKTIYGTELSKLLPETPDPKMNAKEWIKILIERNKTYEEGSFKILYNTYKIILGLQILYGTNSINKYEILQLYQKNVPLFNRKWFGEIIIRNYIGSIYPEKPLIKLETKLLKEFIDGIKELIQ
jgi:predicted nucleotidyltransferase